MSDTPSTFIVLADDGRHTLLGRQATPDASEIASLGAQLKSAGHGGWIARMDGDYWARVGRLDVTAISVAAATITPLTDACAAFRARRRTALGLPPAA